jgi:multidrug efflux pump subunit AcrA (membrane-fusion protein)
MPGAFVAAGAPLLGIVDAAEIWLVAHVPEKDLAVLPELGGAGFRLEGQETENALSMEQWIGEAPVLDVATRSAEVVFTVLNPEGALRPGSSARVTLYGKPGAEGPAVARQAVVDDNGFPTVFVMDGGEGFFKRRIRVGPRDGEWLAVVAGLEPGDRVVSRGAYEVKLSTTAGAIPAHGHQH